MQIDETGCNDQPGRVDGVPAGEHALSDRRNFSGAYADASNAIEPGFRIDDASTDDDEVKVLRCQRDDGHHHEPEQRGSDEDIFHGWVRA
jgi:hypothetical protein